MRNLLKSIILGFTLMLILSCSIFFVSAATIQNNGHKNLYIDINSGQYSAMASVPGWGQNAYTRYGCAWFATARARELTGKDIGTIYDGESWYNYQYANFGFTRGSTPAAKALAYHTWHQGEDYFSITKDTVLSKAEMNGVYELLMPEHYVESFARQLISPTTFALANMFGVTQEFVRKRLEHMGYKGMIAGYNY